MSLALGQVFTVPLCRYSNISRLFPQPHKPG